MRNFLIGLVILLLIGAAIGSFFTFGNFSDGFRAGNIVKFSKRGYVFKTGEGQLNMGGFPAMQTNQPNNYIWEFSVSPKDTELIKEIDSATEHGHRVKLHYHEKYMTFPWTGDTKYHIYKVEKIEEHEHALPAPTAVPVPVQIPAPAH
jgi:hypothetical protein